jgi:hypothetical protein
VIAGDADCFHVHPDDPPQWPRIFTRSPLWMVLRLCPVAVLTALTEIPQFCSPKFPTPGRFRT